MKMNVEEVLKDAEGKEIKDRVKKGDDKLSAEVEVGLTIGKIATLALKFTPPRDQMGRGETLSDDEKWVRWKLVKRILDGEIIDVTVEEISLIKKSIGKYSDYSPYGVELYGSCVDILEKTGEKPEGEKK